MKARETAITRRWSDRRRMSRSRWRSGRRIRTEELETTGSDRAAVRASSGEQRVRRPFVGQGRFTVPEAQNDSRREKSLGLLSQKFVQLFLTVKLNVVSLDTAAEFSG